MAIYIKAFVLLPLLFVSSYARNKHINQDFDDADDSPVGVNFDPSPHGFLEFLDGKKKKKKNNKSNKKNKKNELIFPQFPFPFPFHGVHENQEEVAPLEPAVKVKKKDIPKPDFETENRGAWMLHSPNSGVAAMHIQLMPNNKAVWYDTTNLGQSAIQNNPPFCKPVPERPGETDCWSHGVRYDVESGQVRTLKIMTDTWCSSGGLSSNGELVSTGGYREGIRSIRIMNPCDNCEFQENANGLAAMRWYATQHMLENGSFILVGGRGAHNYEIVPPGRLQFQVQQFGLNFLVETEDEKENNLYPFVNLLPDGNVFIFANDRSIIIDPYSGKTIRDLPVLPGGSRNYPASGMSALLPINLNTPNPEDVEVEIIVCGGNTNNAFKYSEFPPRQFFPALKDCGRLFANRQGAQWDIEEMLSPRVMGDMLLLPTGDILIINGAKTGTSAWDAAEEPNLVPLLYSPNKPKGQRFKELTPSQIPRMYHSVSAVLPDGKILVAGSNTHAVYDFQAKYPTDLRVEKFSPPYLAPELEQQKPQILENGANKEMKYGQNFKINIKLDEVVDEIEIKVTMYAPPFTTHGYSQGQRLLILKLQAVTNQEVTVVAPPSGRIAPPGYYLLFVVQRGVPSRGMWVRIDQ
ncbi:putative aldehyde oxidase Art an 7 [Solanum verrucosum]|uniref:putative aldehyde oxidase Art an 7 n=1 Tax=Solanum verrucosum TaxID=315347 RepID=UPI0020D15205|nr:putative aldehyde oxidase Art an 7 [Solanum verrucosum]